MKQVALFLAACIVAGVFLAIGQRIGQWLIPEPARIIQTLLCVVDEDGAVGYCRDLYDLKPSAEEARE